MDTVSKPSKALQAAVDAVQADIGAVVESMMDAYAIHIPSRALRVRLAPSARRGARRSLWIAARRLSISIK